MTSPLCCAVFAQYSLHAAELSTSQSVVACTVAVLSPPCFSRAISPNASPGPREAINLQASNEIHEKQQYVYPLAESQTGLTGWVCSSVSVPITTGQSHGWSISARVNLNLDQSCHGQGEKVVIPLTVIPVIHMPLSNYSTSHKF